MSKMDYVMEQGWQWQKSQFDCWRVVSQQDRRKEKKFSFQEYHWIQMVTLTHLRLDDNSQFD